MSRVSPVSGDAFEDTNVRINEISMGGQTPVLSIMPGPSVMADGKDLK
jgi:hypothetical protein